MENAGMDYNDWLIWKFGAVVVVVFIYNFWRGLTGR